MCTSSNSPEHQYELRVLPGGPGTRTISAQLCSCTEPACLVGLSKPGKYDPFEFHLTIPQDTAAYFLSREKRRKRPFPFWLKYSNCLGRRIPFWRKIKVSHTLLSSWLTSLTSFIRAIVSWTVCSKLSTVFSSILFFFFSFSISARSLSFAGENPLPSDELEDLQINDQWSEHFRINEHFRAFAFNY